jgi:hypothetical protein
MTEAADSSSLSPAPAGRALNPFQRLAGALFAPAETFADIARKPDVLVPLLLFILIGYATTLVVMPRMDFSTVLDQQREAMHKQKPEMTDKDFEPIARMTMAFAKVAGWVGPLIGAIFYIIIAAIFLLIFRLFGGEGTFVQSLSATLYGWVPMLLFSILMAIVVGVRGTFDPSTAATIVKSNPAFLVDMKEQPVLFSLLSSLDLFTIWTLVLFSIGYAAMSRLSKKTSAILVFGAYFAMVVVKLGFAALTASRMKG